MKANHQFSNSGGRGSKSEDGFEKILIAFTYASAGAMLGAFLGAALHYTRFWLIAPTLLGMILGGLASYNNPLGRMVLGILYSALDLEGPQAPDGMVGIGAIGLGAVVAGIAALIILWENPFWADITKHIRATPPRMFAGAVMGFLVFLLRKRLNPVITKYRPSPSDQLVNAARKDDIDQVSKLLADGVPINSNGGTIGFTPLIAASYSGRIKIVILLIEKGADVHKREKGNDSTALILAAQRGHLDVVLTLISAGAKLNKSNENGVTPIGAAATWGRTHVVQTLLKKGAHIEPTNASGRTPLILAAKHGHLGIVRLPLDNGANVNAECYKRKTALMYARENGFLKVAELILSRDSQAPYWMVKKRRGEP